MLGLCNAAFKKLYGAASEQSAASSVTPEVIQKQLFPDKSLSEVRALWGTTLTLLRNAGAQGVGVRGFQSVVARSKLSDANKKVVLKFWEGKAALAHQMLVERSRFGSQLEYLDWRIDVHASSRGDDTETESRQPSAVLQLGTSTREEPVVFEVSKQQLDHIVDQLAQIEDALAKNE